MKIIRTTIICMILCYSCTNSSEDIFSDERFTDSINQEIGGKLIRNIHYYNDFQSWIYDIKYEYEKDSGIVANIGNATYYCQKPPEHEKITQINEWFIFITSKDRDADYIYISDSTLQNWEKYEISPENIMKSKIWKKSGFKAQEANWDNVSKIVQVDTENKILVDYEFAKKDRIFSFSTKSVQITYKIDSVTGQLVMIKIIDE